MSDWKDDKDLGPDPWNFTKSPDKNYYNEGSHISSKDNPVWELDRVRPQSPITPEHNPHCGYWPNLDPSPIIPPDGSAANIFGLFQAGNTIYGCYWDGVSSITFEGYYKSADGDINSLLLDENDDTVITVFSSDADARLRKIDTTPSGGLLPLDSELDVFNDYDVTRPTASQLVRNEDSDIAYYMDGGGSNVGGRIIELDGTSYVKQKRSFMGTVVTGTDSNLYVADFVYSDWGSQTKPITGSLWDVYWAPIPDNLTDGDIVVYGIGNVVYCQGTEFRALFHDSEIWTCHVVSPFGSVRKLATSDLEMTLKVTPTDIPRDIVVYEDHVFVVEGTNICDLRKYDKGLLTYRDEVHISPGKADRIVQMGGFLIVLNAAAVDAGSIHKVDPASLLILESTTLTGSQLWQEMVPIDNRYLAIGANTSCLIFDITNWSIVDEVEIDPGYSAYSTGDLVVQNI